jgi:DNA recombination protein RmuC
MDRVLFTVAGVGMTPTMVATASGGMLLLVLAALVIIALRANRQHVEAMAARQTELLERTYAQQMADRDARIADRDQRLAERDGRIAAMEQRLDEERDANAALQAEAAALQARMLEQQRQNEENLARFQSARQELADQFKALAGDVLRTQSATFTQQNREQVDLLLKPLSEKITEFHTGLMRDRAALGQHIQTLLSAGMTMSQEANNLVRALKGNAQSQGAWGEMVLSTILEKSGLREGEEFRVQKTHVSDAGGRVRTDVELLLPNGQCVVIDSKVSLNAFDAYSNAEDEETRRNALKAHLGSLRMHVRTLANKDYQRHAGSAVDYVLMFVPIEPAFAEAMKADPHLLDFAHGNGVYLTTPTTLMSTLRTIRNLWDVERRHRNAEEIADRAGALYNKVVGFLGNMDALGSAIGRAQAQFEETRKQLSEGKGSVVRQVEMLRELGAKTNKVMPASWTESTEVDVVKHRARPASGEESEQGWLDALAEEQPRLLAGE